MFLLNPRTSTSPLKMTSHFSKTNTNTTHTYMSRVWKWTSAKRNFLRLYAAMFTALWNGAAAVDGEGFLRFGHDHNHAYKTGSGDECAGPVRCFWRQMGRRMSRSIMRICVGGTGLSLYTVERFFSRIILFVLGFYSIYETRRMPNGEDHSASENENLQQSEERPGAIISNHVTYLDILCHASSSFPSFIAKQMPWLPLRSARIKVV